MNNYPTMTNMSQDNVRKAKMCSATLIYDAVGVHYNQVPVHPVDWCLVMLGPLWTAVYPRQLVPAVI